ncbi:hypothetical protein ACQJBY_026915 [Aegilops geniculata]
MGSAGALLSHPPPQLGSILLRRHHISLPHLSSCMPEPLHCRRRHLRCSAVEGSSSQDTKLPASQREESPSSSLGATLQDPLPGRGLWLLWPPNRKSYNFVRDHSICSPWFNQGRAEIPRAHCFGFFSSVLPWHVILLHCSCSSSIELLRELCRRSGGIDMVNRPVL